MHRLLQGDVGCGKTVVAAMALLPALDNGLQAAWMTPTEVLAWQSFTTLEQWFAPLGVKVVLLKGGMEAGQRRALLGQIGRGEFQLVVGTQALLQPDVRFRRLGMVVIDEQHRFGVAQRQALEHKDEAADFLLMSATPIPQSLAQTLYGDLELVTIKDRPRGSQQISTHLVPEAKREDMYRFVREQLAGSGSAFYVTPRIERDDEEEESELKDVLSSFEQLSRSHFKAIPAALLHGRLSSAEKAACIGQFIEGAIRLLVATTVIEVGIDAPRASIIIIENADRFGLAQLHQLRGRVGRGGQAAWCFLLGGGGDNAEAQQRLRGFCSNHDGFALAELDLRLRGPGAILGRDQSGFGDVHLASILDDIELFGQIQRDLELLLPAEKVSKRSADPTMQG
jgi:ATP-dependent DNA helicase RecG